MVDKIKASKIISKMDLVSIVIPVYNAEKMLDRCIKSIINQTYKFLQIILVDDGSIDNSLKICEKYQKLDSRIEIFHHENKGVSYTRNRGIDQSIGEFIMFVDSDDYLANDMVYKYISQMKKYKCDIVIGGITFISNSNRKKVLPISFGHKNLKELVSDICNDTSGIYGFVPNKMYKLKQIKKYDLKFDTKMKAQEDLDFFLSYLNNIFTAVCIDYCDYFYDFQGYSRGVPINDYMNNKLKLVKLAKKFNLNFDKTIELIQTQLFLFCYNCNSVIELKQLSRTQLLLELIRCNVTSNTEVKVVCYLYFFKLYRLIISYFFIRMKLLYLKRIVK